MTRTGLLLAILLISMFGSASGETIEGLTVHVEKFDSGAIRVWVGDLMPTSASIAIPTSEGIVVIDTTGVPKIDRELRRVIARELGRDDFKYLINTHEHGDHTGGNSVYADCTLVAHELLSDGIAKLEERRPGGIEWMITRIAALEEEIANPTEETDVARAKEFLILNRLRLEHDQSNPKFVAPNKTFSDRMELIVGDTTFELYYIGGMHTASDIAVFVPEHRMLMTGDTMADVWLTDAPGCLASFIARPEVEHNFPLLLENWNALLAKKKDIGFLVPSHWNGQLSFEGFENRVQYIEALWNGVNASESSVAGLVETLTGYSLRERFPDLVDSPGCSQGNNRTTILEMWATVNNQVSAAKALRDLLEEGIDKAAIKRIMDQHGSEEAAYFFLENEMNAYAYNLFQNEKVAEASIMFRLNTELFPDSWNTYDSLGEALFTAGKHDEAIAMYEKSLELNPENENGQRMLKQIQEATTVGTR